MPMVERMIDVSPVATEAEERLSPEVYDAAWQDGLTLDEVHSSFTAA
jgi:hypothetical protein